MNNLKWEKIMDYGGNVLDWSVAFVGKLVLALLLIGIGLRLIKVVMRFLKKSFQRHNMEASVTTFLLSFISIALKMLLLLTGASILGFDMTSFLALVGSAGIAVGLALQGSLANIAGGVLILILKPFKVGDYIKEDSKNNEGTVVGIDIFYTKLQSADNKTIVIPNGVISNSSLTNVTKQDKRRLDLLVSVSYTEDIRKIRGILMKLLEDQEQVLQEDGIDIFVNSFENSYMAIGLRAWVPMDAYWNIRWAVLEEIKDRFDENGIEIAGDKIEVKML